MSTPTLPQLRAFLAIADAGSFRGAARQLGLSQAGLSSSVHALESMLGVPLFDRNGRGIALTAAGQRLIARARLIDNETRRVLDDAVTEHAGAAGVLHVGVGPTPTALLLPVVVPDFHARFPRVTLRLMSGLYERLTPALNQGAIELMITSTPPDGVGHGYESRPLFKSELSVVARGNHPLIGARQLADLTTCEWILMGSPGVPGGTALRLFADHGLPPPRVAATCENFTEVAALLSGTNWLALVPTIVAEKGMLGQQIQIIHLPERAYRFEICVVHRAESALTPAASAFAAMCESCARIVRPRIQ